MWINNYLTAFLMAIGVVVVVVVVVVVFFFFEGGVADIKFD